MRIIHIVLAGWLLTTVSNNCFGEAWRGIIPLKSSRADVERLLGPPTGPLVTYYLSDVTVDFWYSKCRCGDKCKNDLWNVPPDTVTSIRVNLKGLVRLADLKLDLSQFKKLRLADDVPRSFIYTNEKEGLDIEGGNEYASALIYGPRLEDNHLRCSPPSPAEIRGKYWHGIVPLHSTRADVERLLGQPNAKYGRYDIGNEQATITYIANQSSLWDVPNETVTSIMVSYHRTVCFSNLQLDLTRFKRSTDPHVTNHAYYTNSENGIRYVVWEGPGDANGTVLYVVYEPSANDAKQFRRRSDPRNAKGGRSQGHQNQKRIQA